MDDLICMHHSSVHALRSAQRYERDVLHALQEACANAVDADNRRKIEGLRNSCREMFGLTDSILKTILDEYEQLKKHMSECISGEPEPAEVCLAA